MLGRRVEYETIDWEAPEAGVFFRHPVDGHWYGITPNGHLAGLASHSVVEHENGSITVAPSILVRGGRASDDGIRVTDGSRELWHGYLERGVWRSC